MMKRVVPIKKQIIVRLRCQKSGTELSIQRLGESGNEVMILRRFADFSQRQISFIRSKIVLLMPRQNQGYFIMMDLPKLEALMLEVSTNMGSILRI